MTVRAKFQLQEVVNNFWSKTSKKLIFRPAYDTSISEDQRFAQATPSGELWMLVDNPAALEAFTLGEYYYFAVTPVPATTTKS